jgi:hypothetical protein
MQKSLITTLRPMATVGEEVGLELGDKMVLSYQQKNPDDVFAYEIGRDIIDQILAQPGCVGIKFFNAYNEEGEKTLVYVGLDNTRKTMTEITLVTSSGDIVKKKGIVADRIKPPISKPAGIAGDSDDWGWTID